MKRIISCINSFCDRRIKKKELLKNPSLKIKFRSNSSIVLGCMGFLIKNGKDVLTWNNIELVIKEKPNDLRNFFKKVYNESRLKKISPQKYLDELAEITRLTNLRRSAYTEFLTQITRANLDELLEHIFTGHLRSTPLGRGRRAEKVPSTKGIHSEDLLDEAINRIEPNSRRPPNPLDDEVYSASVQMKDRNGEWVNKLNRQGNIINTTMFPLNWNRQRIMEEVAYAFKNKVPDLSSPVHYKAFSTNNIEIIFVIDNNNIIKTVYPKN